MDKKKAEMTQKEMEQKFKGAVFDAISAKIPGCYIEEETGFLVIPNAIRRRKPSAVSASDSNQNKS